MFFFTLSGHFKLDGGRPVIPGCEWTNVGPAGSIPVEQIRLWSGVLPRGYARQICLWPSKCELERLILPCEELKEQIRSQVFSDKAVWLNENHKMKGVKTLYTRRGIPANFMQPWCPCEHRKSLIHFGGRRFVKFLQAFSWNWFDYKSTISEIISKRALSEVAVLLLPIFSEKTQISLIHSSSRLKGRAWNAVVHKFNFIKAETKLNFIKAELLL